MGGWRACGRRVAESGRRATTNDSRTGHPKVTGPDVVLGTAVLGTAVLGASALAQLPVSFSRSAASASSEASVPATSSTGAADE